MLPSLSAVSGMFAGLRRAATAKKHGRTARLKSVPKSENKNYNHFTPIKGQGSALTMFYLKNVSVTPFLLLSFSKTIVATIMAATEIAITTRKVLSEEREREGDAVAVD